MDIYFIIRITLAGEPAANDDGGISLVTTLPAPMIAPLPICTPGMMQDLAPIHTLSSMMTGPFDINGRWFGAMSSMDGSEAPCELSVMSMFLPILTLLPRRISLMAVTCEKSPIEQLFPISILGLNRCSPKESVAVS